MFITTNVLYKVSVAWENFQLNFWTRLDMKFLCAVLFLVVLGAVEGKKNKKSCPPLCVNSSVEITNEKLEGIWFLQYSIPFFFEENYKCSYMNITAFGKSHLSFIKSDYGES